MSKISRFGLAAGVAAALVASAANAQVRRPSTPHAAFNFIPFGGSQVCTQHQVFASSLWSGPMEISALGFAVNNGLNGQSYESDIVIKLGYTDKIPGLDTISGGLDAILANNPSGPLTEVFNQHVNTTLMGSGTEDFQFILRFDRPFCYDPANGNLLVEIFSSWTSGADLSVGRTSGSSESSRAYDGTRFGNAASPTTATRIDFYEDTCSGGGYTLRLDGSCPGTVRVSWDGAPANATQGIVFGQNTGSTNIPGGPCQGTVLGIQGGVMLVRTVNTGGGSGSVSGNAGTPACGHFLQLVAVGNPCQTSNVAQIP